MAYKGTRASFPDAPAKYDPGNEAEFRRAVERVFIDALTINPQEWVTISSSAPTGTPRHGQGSWWIRTGTVELHSWDGDSWVQVV